MSVASLPRGVVDIHSRLGTGLFPYWDVGEGVTQPSISIPSCSSWASWLVCSRNVLCGPISSTLWKRCLLKGWCLVMNFHCFIEDIWKGNQLLFFFCYPKYLVIQNMMTSLSVCGHCLSCQQFYLLMLLYHQCTSQHDEKGQKNFLALIWKQSRPQSPWNLSM